MPTTVLLQACRDAQRNEVDVLQSIFTHELTVAHTRPFCMRVIVALDDIDCRVRVFVCFVLSCNALRSFLVAGFVIRCCCLDRSSTMYVLFLTRN